jgi:DNA (cytosine-5)-methyltransferase 1
MRYLSVCSGIESASVAWLPLAWTPVAYAEIEPFACAVLAHHYPDVVNLGDINDCKDWPATAFDVLVGGTPCQSFSIAGLRDGLADPRGNLALVYLAIAERYRPRWLVWENVPGALSTDDGRDFASIVGGMVELGYSACWRSLDAQFVCSRDFPRAVPQRRKRLLVVGHLGDWRRAGQVFFDGESLRGNPAPRRQARQGNAGASATGDVAYDTDGLIPDIVTQAVNAKWHKGTSGPAGDEVVNLIAVADPICANEERTWSHAGNNCRPKNLIPVAFDMRGRDGGAQMEGPHDTANLRSASGGSSRSYVAGLRVRRLMPIECERLMGLPDNYTLVPYRGGMAKDGPRYIAIGNAMAVNVIQWVGERIEMVEGIT